MKFAIISAGEGSRLANEGISLPKPLIPLCGSPMMERLIHIFVKNGAEEICVIVNERQPQTIALLKELQQTHPLRIMVKDTSGSMQSFYWLSRWLRDECFCLTTVDAIFQEKEFESYIKAFSQSGDDGMMAVTSFVDDEKPLYLSVDDRNYITGFYDDCPQSPSFVSGGIYGLTPRSIPVLETCMEEGVSRMRDFQRRLVTGGLRLKAYPFSKILDVDHVADIAKAEQFLRTSQK